ncbi:MAG: family 43 glycosylhydrolase, partial [Bacteroidales bacterium]|nr:family 43 glycosylhydrolase [Bacteroidales bacterium]
MQRSKLYLLLITLLTGTLFPALSQEPSYLDQNNGNPLTPGYFADPTILKVDDTYYIYATGDGVRLASGEPQIWQSKDFVNWYNQEIDIPTSLTNIWAPDVLFVNNKYYYFHGNCEAGCNVYGYESDSPLGPWTAINSGNALFTPNTIGGVPALDQHYFLDDDGSLYVYYGTWISSFAGLAWARVDTNDMVTILESGNIANSQLPEIFEAPYMLKKNDKYIMMYSSGDCQASSYRVQYAYSDSPVGPFTFGENNPILETNADGSVDGPGHHSVLKEVDDYYIVYHRHDNPHSTGGEFRQLCVDSLIFENDSTIRKVAPSHAGIGYLGPNQITATDHAHGAAASATSYYHLEDGVNDYVYYPSCVVDNNNGTIWRAGDNDMPHSLVIDLGSDINIKRVMTQFEYAFYYYQYTIEYSSDSASWEVFADRSDNRESGSPMIDDGDVTARYLRITVSGTQKTGMFAAIWNVKVYSELFELPSLTPVTSDDGPGTASSKSLLVELDASLLLAGEIEDDPANAGSLNGAFTIHGNPVVDTIYKVKSINLDGSDYFVLSEEAPLSLSWNSAFTISAWVYNKKITLAETVVSWSKRTDNLMGEYAALMIGTSTTYGAAAHWGRLDMPY